MKYADMTEAEMLAWGRCEADARVADLAGCGLDALKAAQENARQRRLAVGATRSQATYMVIAANRAKRIADYEKERALA